MRRQGHLSWVIVAFVLITFFQNCDGQFSTQDMSSSSESAAGTGDGGTMDPNLTPDQQARLNACKALMGKAAITSQTATEVTIMSGAGNGSGDVSAPAVTLTVNRAISSQAQADALACNFGTNIQCNIVSDDTSRVPVLNNAIRGDGVQMAGTDMSDTNAEKATILGQAFSRGNNNCSGAVDANSQRRLNLTNNRNQNNNNEIYRCVSGTVWLRITATTQIDNNNRAPASDPIYLKVNLNDNCWGESRLKTSAALPSISSYGRSVAMDGDWSAVVAEKENLVVSGNTITGAGSLYIFRRTNGVWSQSQKIVLSGIQAEDTHTAVAIKGNRLVITSYKNGNRGLAVIYTYNGSSWVESQTLTPPMNDNGQKFGSSVALSDSYLVIGAPAYSAGGDAADDNAGAAYVYSCNTSSCTYKHSIIGSAGNVLGASLSLDGSNLAVGAPQATVVTTYGLGLVRIYNISGASASLVRTLTPASGEAGMLYGASVALSGTKLLVGAPQRNDGDANPNAGAVYYYADYNAAVTRTIVGPDPSVGMGQSVAWTSAGAVLSCHYCRGRSGAVMYYSQNNLQSNNGAVSYQVFALNETENSAFGYSLAVSGNRVIVGAFQKSDPARDSGAAFIYEMR